MKYLQAERPKERQSQRVVGFLYRARQCLLGTSGGLGPMTPPSDGGGSRFEPLTVSSFRLRPHTRFSKRRSAARHAVLGVKLLRIKNK